ncbi:MAG: hypothetical protein AB8E15_11530 [Bdellovibrionales bacterium]
MKYSNKVLSFVLCFGLPVTTIAAEFVTVGGFGKHRGDSFLNQLATELFKEASKKDRLYKDMDFEIPISISPLQTGPIDNFDVSLRSLRRVNVDNPFVEGDSLNQSDYAKYRLSNTLLTRTEIGARSGNFGSNVEAGVYFGVARSVYPRDSAFAPTSKMSLKEICQESGSIYIPYAVADLSKGDRGLEVGDTGINWSKYDCHDPSKLDETMEKIVGKLNGFFYWLMNKFTDSEKMKMMADQLLEAVLNYNRFGLFSDNIGLFYEQNKALNVGDTVQHITYYQVNPLTFLPEILPFMETRLSPYFIRASRDVRVVKLPRNMVRIEVYDDVEDGYRNQFGRIRPRILLPKISLLKWQHEDTKAWGEDKGYTRIYEIDLNLEEAARFFVQMMNEIYWPGYDRDDFRADKEVYENQFTDQSELPEGVVFKDATYRITESSEYYLQARIPGLFKYRNRRMRETVKEESVTGTVQAKTEVQLQDSDQWRVKILNLFDKVERELACNLVAETYDGPYAINKETNNPVLSSNIAINFDCAYRDEFPKPKMLTHIANFIEAASSGNTPADLRDAIESIPLGKKSDDLRFATQISMNMVQVEEMLQNATFDRVFLNIIGKLYGEPYLSEWRKVAYRNDNPVSNIKRQINRLRAMRSPSSTNSRMLFKYIPKSYTERMGGLFAPSKDTFTLNSHRGGSGNSSATGSYGRQFRFLKQNVIAIAKSLSDIRNERAEAGADAESMAEVTYRRLLKVQDLFSRLNQSALLASVIFDLVDHNKNTILFKASVDALSLEAPIEFKFGQAAELVSSKNSTTNMEEHRYEVDRKNTDTSRIFDVNEARDRNKRITHALVQIKHDEVEHQDRPDKIYLQLFSSHSFPDESVFEIEIKDWEALGKSKTIAKLEIPVGTPCRIENIISQTFSEFNGCNLLDALAANGARKRYTSSGLKRALDSSKFGYLGLEIPVGPDWDINNKYAMYVRVKNFRSGTYIDKFNREQSFNGEWLSEEAEFAFNLRH